MNVSTVPPVPQTRGIQINLSGEEAELLREILFAIYWASGVVGTFAHDLCEKLGDADVDCILGETKIFHTGPGTLQITLRREMENNGQSN